MNTAAEYKAIIGYCKAIFQKKHQDYGSAWRIMRLPSITDQIFIKAKRIRAIQENKVQKIAEDIRSEYIGIINYCIIALIQLSLDEDAPLELPYAPLEEAYDAQVEATLELLLAKNHDYGEAWREMRTSSMTDLILMKLHRVKQIEDNEGKTAISEGVAANYQDILNYSVFCLIKLDFLKREVAS